MIKIGKIGKANIVSNKKIKKMFEEKEIFSCELRLPGCTGSYMLSFAHRHKRVWYHPHMMMLWEYKQVVLACLHCHGIIEKDKGLTAELFMKLRGSEEKPY